MHKFLKAKVPHG
jgi:hypothetical protein